MRAYGLRTANGPTISWRAIECWGAGVSLFLQTGALFPLMMADADGDLGDPAKAKLRLLSLPVYAFAGLILIRNFPQFLIALRRNLLFPLLLAPAVFVCLVVGEPINNLEARHRPPVYSASGLCVGDTLHTKTAASACICDLGNMCRPQRGHCSQRRRVSPACPWTARCGASSSTRTVSVGTPA